MKCHAILVKYLLMKELEIYVPVLPDSLMMEMQANVVPVTINAKNALEPLILVISVLINLD